MVRAHVTALGGNAMVSFYMSELTLVDNPHKNQVYIRCEHSVKSQMINRFLYLLLFDFQGQTLISVGGDVVFVSYFTGTEYAH